jgi:hypothetical protein
MFDIESRGRTVTLHPGEVFVVPKGVEHRSMVQSEFHILLIRGDKLRRRASSPKAKRSGTTALRFGDQPCSAP